MYKKKKPSSSFSRSKRPRKNYSKLFDDTDKIDYKNIQLVEQFITERGRIIPRRITGISAQQQRSITTAVKRARVMALIPFSATQLR